MRWRLLLVALVAFAVPGQGAPPTKDMLSRGFTLIDLTVTALPACSTALDGYTYVARNAGSSCTTTGTNIRLCQCVADASPAWELAGDGGAGSGFALDGDNNTPVTIDSGEEALIAGGKGVLTAASPTPDKVTVNFKYTDSRTTNSLGLKECVFTTDEPTGVGGGGFLCEGNTDDGLENLWLFPNVNGTTGPADYVAHILTGATVGTDTIQNLEILLGSGGGAGIYVPVGGAGVSDVALSFSSPNAVLTIGDATVQVDDLDATNPSASNGLCATKASSSQITWAACGGGGYAWSIDGDDADAALSVPNAGTLLFEGGAGISTDIATGPKVTFSSATNETNFLAASESAPTLDRSLQIDTTGDGVSVQPLLQFFAGSAAQTVVSVPSANMPTGAIDGSVPLWDDATDKIVFGRPRFGAIAGGTNSVAGASFEINGTNAVMKVADGALSAELIASKVNNPRTNTDIRIGSDSNAGDTPPGRDTANVVITGNRIKIGNGIDGPGVLDFQERSTNGVNRVALRVADADIAADVAFNLPTTVGTPGYHLATDGTAGTANLSWVAPSDPCVNLRAGDITCPTVGGCQGEMTNGTTGNTFMTANFNSGVDSFGVWNFRVPPGWTGSTAKITIDWIGNDVECSGGTASGNHDRVCWAVKTVSVVADATGTANAFLNPTFAAAKGANDTLCLANGDLMRTTISGYAHGMTTDQTGILNIARDGLSTFVTGCTDPDGGSPLDQDDYVKPAKIVNVQICKE